MVEDEYAPLLIDSSDGIFLRRGDFDPHCLTCLLDVSMIRAEPLAMAKESHGQS